MDIADFAAQFATSPALCASIFADEARAQGAPAVRTTSVSELSRVWRHSPAGLAVMGGAPPERTPKPESVATPTPAAPAGGAGEDLTPTGAGRADDINASRPRPGALDAAGVVLPPGSAAELAYSRSQGGVGFLASLRLLVWRQSRTLSRNKPLIGAKIGQSIFLGFIIGSLFWSPDPSNYILKIGLALFASTSVSYSSMAEVPVAFMSKRLVSRQVSQGLCEW